jgi:hypothetical protein
VSDIESLYEMPFSVSPQTITIIIIALIAIIIIATVFYLAECIALYIMANNQKISNSWFIFLPFARFYVIGKLSGPFKMLSYKVDKPESFLVLSSIICFAAGIIPFFGIIIGLLPLIFYFYALLAIFKKYCTDQEAKWMLLFCSLFPFMIPIYLFKIRNLTPITLNPQPSSSPAPLKGQVIDDFE